MPRRLALGVIAAGALLLAVIVCAGLDRKEGVIGAAAGALACVLAIGKTVRTEARRRAVEGAGAAGHESQADAPAVRRLLHELGVLAHGNLGVRASESETSTRAVARAINQALEELERRFGAIHHAATRLVDACGQVQSAGGEVLNASQCLAQKTATLRETLTEAAAPARQASERAADCLRAVGQVLGAAGEASGALRRSSAGIDAIRSRMQTAAMRVKRLGESSLELGEAVERTGGMTRRADTPERSLPGRGQSQRGALDRAIPTTTTATDERGLAALDEAVQRPAAGRPAEAVHWVETLIASLRDDARESAAAMENVTQAVLAQGALARAACAALGRLEPATREIARQAGAITEAAHRQHESVERVHAVVADIARMTGLATEATRANADRSAQLSALAHTLSQSLACIRRSSP